MHVVVAFASKDWCHSTFQFSNYASLCLNLCKNRSGFVGTIRNVSWS